MRKLLLIGMTCAMLGGLAGTATADQPHFVGSKSCTFDQSNSTLTCSFKVAGLGNVSQASVRLAFDFTCTNRGDNNPPGQASTNTATVPVSNGQITVTNKAFTTNASCPDQMTPSAGQSAELFVTAGGQTYDVGSIPVTNQP
jgi:hypothetical protein